MLEKLLRSTAECKVLGVVLFSGRLHLREIARRASVSPFEARRELGILCGARVLKSEKEGRQVYFSRDERCVFWQDLKNLYLKTDGVFAELKKGLDKLDGIKYAFIYGSMAGGKDRPNSDVDLMVIGSINEDELDRVVFGIQRKTGREINYILWGEAMMGKRAQEGSSFLKEIIKSKRAWLAGDENEFVGNAKEGLNKKS